MRVGDRVLTSDLRLATITAMHRTLDRVRGGEAQRGEWYAVVQMDNGGAKMQWLRELVPAPPEGES